MPNDILLKYMIDRYKVKSLVRIFNILPSVFIDQLEKKLIKKWINGKSKYNYKDMWKNF